MFRLFFLIFLLFFSSGMILGNSSKSSDVSENITEKQSREIIKKITDKYSRMYKKYAGVESVRKETQKWKKVGSEELLKTEDIVYKRRDYFYKNLEYDTESYAVDGKKKDPDDFSSHEDKPGIPVFDKNGHKEYTRKVEGIDTIKGRECYRILVDPKNPETTHFKGHIWVTTDNLELILTKGESGKKRFGCKDLSVEMWSKDFGDFYHFTSGKIRVNISVFRLYRRILEIEFKNTEIKPIPLKK